MSEQRGLRNPDTHGTTSDGEPYCESCGVCDEGWRCRCCLAAEVDRQRRLLDAVRGTCEQRLEDERYAHGAAHAVLRALDGDA